LLTLVFVYDGSQATEKIIQYLEKIDAEPVEEEEEETCDYTLFNVSAYIFLRFIFSYLVIFICACPPGVRRGHDPPPAGHIQHRPVQLHLR